MYRAEWIKTLGTAALLMSMITVAAGQSGGNFTITQSVIAGGGGRSDGGGFTLDGTAGQPLAGTTSAGGNFTLFSGFWTPGPMGVLSGSVSYGTTPVGQPAKFVPGVLLSASGSIPVNGSTNAGGAYLLSGFGAGLYTVTPTKSGDVNGISALDAARVAQHAAGLIVLDTNQQLAGDATNNGVLSALDASRIAQFAAGITNPGIAGQWKFVPASRGYGSVTNSLSNENYEAILVGDVTGNWTPPPVPGTIDQPESGLANTSDSSFISDRNRQKSNHAAKIELPASVTIGPGNALTLPISIADTTARGVVAYAFTLEFDSNVLSLNPVNTVGTLTSGWSVTVNTELPGRITVVAFSPNELAGAGTLLNLNFSVMAGHGATTPLKWTRFELNEDEILPALLNSGVAGSGVSVNPRVSGTGTLSSRRRDDHK